MYFVNTHDKVKRLGKCSPSIRPIDTIIHFLTLVLVKFCDLVFSAQYIISYLDIQSKISKLRDAKVNNPVLDFRTVIVRTVRWYMCVECGVQRQLF